MKAVLDYLPGPRVRAILDEVFGDRVNVVCVAEADAAGLNREAADCDVRLHVLKPVAADFIQSASRLRLVQKIGIGVDTIDLAAAKAKSVAVCNMPGTNTQAVAELALSLMLAAVRRLKPLDRETFDGRGWERGTELFDGIGEIGGVTVGLLGYGAVPRRMAPVLKALGANVVTYARREPEDGTRRLELEELLAVSDIVSLHLPLSNETLHLLDEDRIALMKKGAIIVNTARGGLIDEAALAIALEKGHIAGAAVDVFSAEPVKVENPLLRAPNVLATPHVAWLTTETWRRSFIVARENCERLRRGEPLLHRVA